MAVHPLPEELLSRLSRRGGPRRGQAAAATPPHEEPELLRRKVHRGKGEDSVEAEERTAAISSERQWLGHVVAWWVRATEEVYRCRRVQCHGGRTRRKRPTVAHEAVGDARRLSSLSR